MCDSHVLIVKDCLNQASIGTFINGMTVIFCLGYIVVRIHVSFEEELISTNFRVFGFWQFYIVKSMFKTGVIGYFL
ncbi:uncharacterized protein RJT21DRAFT_119832 [Scheffersomyces amazonensis]|uniref:uncharacterized protein n=1 Tax=Scheffersomyces amazonensis TaxID=1078765 RepID=UPI00315DDCA4